MDFEKLYQDLGTSVTYDIVPGVRSTGVTNGGQKWHCVDDHSKEGCQYERFTLCAWDQESTLADKVAFLECMDTPWSDQLTPKKAKSCAQKQGISLDAVTRCVDGSRGDALLLAASKKFTTAFPKPVQMPQTAVNGKEVDADYKDLKKAACDAGAKSSAC